MEIFVIQWLLRWYGDVRFLILPIFITNEKKKPSSALQQAFLNVILIIISSLMSEPQKKQKKEDEPLSVKTEPNFEKIYSKILQASKQSEDHNYVQLLKNLRLKKHPILQVIQPQNEIYKTNPQKKKKPIELYLDAVNHLYKKRDLDILINPVTPVFVFEKWAPREVAIFEEAILRFGKQFEFIAELIQTKNAKDVYEFYLQWKSTSHFKSYRSHTSANNRNNIQDYV